MTPRASREAKICVWIFVGSFFVTPLLLWLFVTQILGRDYSFRDEYLDIYKDMFSLQPDAVYAWLILLVPVVIYEFVFACRHYYQHPRELRSVFQFPRKGRKDR
ncbi:MAG: hypothetical protein U1F83_07420 [Verrucomicrobiota bacterium]